MNDMRPAAADDTIFALATGVGRSAIAVLRMSGPACGVILRQLCTPPPPRIAALRILRNGAGEILDRAVVLWLPAPRSYTGEDTAELHLHGGNAVLDAAVGALTEFGARPAEPGEFTRRAFMAGKLDLLEAEAVADLIDAETPEQRAQALRQLGGEQSRLLQDWASRLLHSLALQEATIDFSDEDLPDIEADLLNRLKQLRDELRQHVASARVGERLRRGLVFVITGAPNVGKSSLLNSLVGRDAAIVASRPGTTRDLIAVETVIAGYPVTLIDTAGIRETDDETEAEGIRRARAQAANADMIIEVIDAKAKVTAGPHSLLVFNKIDLAPAPAGVLGISLRTGRGLDWLSHELEIAARRLAGAGGLPTFNRARHVAALREAQAALEEALACRNAEMRAEELRLAVRALGKIGGQVDSEDMLDVVFSTFCIGK